ncbi:lantibiotic dehydratase family protein [Chryseobacterium sp.]|uniref:lantibiotic dehydratase family protein n=1 Tax=Chryseobacterium sp. TaxID=1871047 RepID=UPI002FC61FEC
MSRFPYQFFEQYIFRSPLFPLNLFLEKMGNEKISEEDLKKICSDPIYLEAVYLASPYLYGEIEKWMKGGEPLSAKKQAKLKQTILKYYNRMSARCTPFGLFAGVGLGVFQENAHDEFERTCVRDTKLDMHFLVALSQHLAKIPEIHKKLLYFPNTSIYHVGRRIRYVEYEYLEGKRQYIISSIDRSNELDEILNKTQNGKTPNELIQVLNRGEITEPEAAEFIHELIENQILVSQLEPNVSGDDFLNIIIKILTELELETEAHTLKTIRRKLEELDKKIGNSTQPYKETEDLLSSLKVDYDKKFLFQTDLYFENSFKLPIHWKKTLKTAIAFFNKINIPSRESDFERFKNAFREKFDTKEVALSYVMDTEIGIGYQQGKTARALHPYLEDLVIPQLPDKKGLHFNLNAVQVILNSKIQECLQENQYSIELFDEDFKGFEENWTDLPDTLSVMAEIYTDKGQEKLHVYRGGGSTAAEMSARFCSGKSDISSYTRSITEKEKRLNPDIILAEIVHLPEARIGNVIRRPVLREYEIPYLAASTLPKEKQIAIDDLYISLKNDKIILRSLKHNKEVRPYLTNAHNYSSDSLPVYHFLSDLYFQTHCPDLGFDWGDLARIYHFLPRVEYKNIILVKARWQIRKEDIDPFLFKTEKIDLFLSTFKIWRNKKKIPQWVQLTKLDNTLILNLENYDSVQLFIDTVEIKKSVTIEEFLHHEKTDFAYQFVFSLYKNDK